VIEARGIKVTAGATGQRPANASFVVTYVDRWAWDMRTFLRDIRIEGRDAKTGAIVADAHATASSWFASVSDCCSRLADAYAKI
jgi:hypothetical protein